MNRGAWVPRLVAVVLVAGVLFAAWQLSDAIDDRYPGDVIVSQNAGLL